VRTWTTTSWIYRTFGEKVTTTNSKSNRWNDGIWSKFIYSTNFEKLEVALNDVMNYCNKNQLSVKSIIPLTEATAKEYGQSVEYSSFANGVGAVAGIGHGWGFSNVVGFAALLEKVEQISEEEYQTRICANEPTPPPLVPA
jgi:hypothetical protein